MATSYVTDEIADAMATSETYFAAQSEANETYMVVGDISYVIRSLESTNSQFLTETDTLARLKGLEGEREGEKGLEGEREGDKEAEETPSMVVEGGERESEVVHVKAEFKHQLELTKACPQISKYYYDLTRYHTVPHLSEVASLPDICTVPPNRERKPLLPLPPHAKAETVTYLLRDSLGMLGIHTPGAEGAPSPESQ
ncbi:hypothetical protein KIPB_010591, partial [Kipferlia bialata]|eukprot:g10591.t1